MCHVIDASGGRSCRISRRDLLRGAAGVAAAGSLPLVLGAGNAVAASHPTLRTGSHGAAVLALQRRLTSLGYWLGAADGQFGDLTRQAVVAVQKVAGLARDGVCGPATWARVDASVRPAAHTTMGRVVEIDKKTQTLLLVATPASSGGSSTPAPGPGASTARAARTTSP